MTIALQLESGRVEKAFAPSTTLWQMLRELDGGSVARVDGATGLYLEPVLVFMNQQARSFVSGALVRAHCLLAQFVGVRTLVQTTLQSVGLVSGSAVFRVSFRPSQDGLATLDQVRCRHRARAAAPDPKRKPRRCKRWLNRAEQL